MTSADTTNDDQPDPIDTTSTDDTTTQATSPDPTDRTGAITTEAGSITAKAPDEHDKPTKLTDPSAQEPAVPPTSSITSQAQPSTQTDHTSPRDTAATAIERLLASREIKRIVIVDDTFDTIDDEDTRDLIVGAAGRILDTIRDVASRKPELELTDPLDDIGPDDPDPADIDALRAALSDAYDDLDDADVALLSAAARHAGGFEPTNGDGDGHDDGVELTKVFADLKELVPPDVDFVTVGVKQWNSNPPPFGTDEGRTLIFIDRDLGPHGGDYAGQQGGNLLLSAFLKTSGAASTTCCIFTKDAPDLASEMAAGRELEKLIGTFVTVLGKTRAQDPLMFAKGLRVVLQATDLYAIKSHTLSVLERSHEKTRAYVEDVDSHTVMASAEKARSEGGTESDGLLRLGEAILRRAVQEEFRKDAPMDAIQRVREAAADDAVWLPRTGEASQHEWNERFDSSEYLASCRRPLELGDIFTITNTDGATSTYILVVQPCDLMVRSSGKRANAQTTFLLIQIRPLPDQDPNAKHGSRWVPIGRYDPEADELWGVDLGKRLNVPTQILDACVFSDTGQSVLAPNLTPDPMMSQGWGQLARKLKAWRTDRIQPITKIAKKVATSTSGKSEDVRLIQHTLHMGALGAEFVDGTIKAEVNISTGVVTTDIRRVARLVEAQSRDVLARLAAHIGRLDTPGDLLAMEWIRDQR